MTDNINVLVWNEYRHEQSSEEIAKLYPKGIHGAIADSLQSRPEIGKIACANLDESEQGLTKKRLAETDVIVWWSHIANDEVEDKIVDRLHEAVLGGMGLIVLHSAIQARIFRRLMGTSCRIRWREDGEKERVWVTDPAHPIARGLDEFFELQQTEMYGEPFDVPPPDELVFISWFEGGEIFRSGCCYHRGRGKIFYFRPGHETYPIYYDENVLNVLYNACLWAAPNNGPDPTFGNQAPLEET
ncbi:MAG: ThuA domain-containing protein [Candidatus Brocadiia bacterium]